MPRYVAKPPMLRTIADCEIQAAGHLWDAIRIPHSVALRTLEILGHRSGAVIEDGFGRVMYWFVPVGTAATWDLPQTRSLGASQHLTVPPARRTTGPGPRWRICPGDCQLLTDVAALRSAVADALTPLLGPRGAAS